jgi:hypothetical protein
LKLDDASAKKIIDDDHTREPIAQAARFILRRFLDARGTIRALKAIIEALKIDNRKRGGNV